jgi:phospholipid/cholesterol/gamma-HCH transport system substrate-binding protein
MEDRAKYVLVGLFTFAVIAGVFGFVFWLHNTAGNKESATYRVIFDGSVTGLRVGAPVLFNGIRVGDVSNLSLTDNPGQVVVMLAVNQTTPIRTDTQVSLEYAGLTGIASVSLKGALASAPILKKKGNEPPTLIANASASQDMGQAVRDTLNKANEVISENQESLHKAILNLETFTEALARNGTKLDTLMTNGNAAIDSFKKLSDNLDQRTAEITKSVNRTADTATKQIDIVGGDAHRTILHVDKAVTDIDNAVTDLAKHPQRFIFGGGGG